MDSDPAFNVVLISPEIPQNTGNVIRLCANIGARLHLVEPLGFELENSRLRRASLDYRDLTEVVVYKSTEEFFERVSISNVYGAAIPGTVPYTTPSYQNGDTIVFGPESTGLPCEVLKELDVENIVGIPMVPASRSLNLSNAVAIIVYEMWRQIGFPGSISSLNNPQSHFS